MNTGGLNRQQENRYDVEAVRKDFPILEQRIYDKPLVYLDNAASTQKPNVVIDEISRFYREDYSNIHRGVHALSQRATAKYEAARDRCRDFLGAADSREIVFLRGTTEAVNLVAYSFVLPQLSVGDEIVVSAMEHHSNIVPWQLIAKEAGAKIRVIPMDDSGALIIDAYEKLLSDRTKIVALTHLSNALGTVNPVKSMIETAHEKGIPVLLDGAQAVARMPVDVQDLDCDFYAFSGHKVYAPSGIGALYAKSKYLENMRPYQGGGEMILKVTFDETVYNDIPARFEAGTPNIVGAVAMAKALDYIDSLDRKAIEEYEHSLLVYADQELGNLDFVRQIGVCENRAGLVTFLLDGIHPHDAGTILDREGIAVRAGHHCAQPVMMRFGVTATIRASFGVYTTHEEIDALVRGLNSVREIFA